MLKGVSPPPLRLSRCDKPRTGATSLSLSAGTVSGGRVLSPPSSYQHLEFHINVKGIIERHFLILPAFIVDWVMHLSDFKKKLFICFESIFEVLKPRGDFLVFIFLLGHIRFYFIHSGNNLFFKRKPLPVLSLHPLLPGTLTVCLISTRQRSQRRLPR